eukprot:2120936-Alexandrium_andersonii.AAC.1
MSAHHPLLRRTGGKASGSKVLPIMSHRTWRMSQDASAPAVSRTPKVRQPTWHFACMPQTASRSSGAQEAHR